MPKGSPKSGTERSRAMRERLAMRGLRQVTVTVPVTDEAWFRAQAAERCEALRVQQEAWARGELERMEFYVPHGYVGALREWLEKVRGRESGMERVDSGSESVQATGQEGCIG